jgi:hypothetical protein
MVIGLLAVGAPAVAQAQFTDFGGMADPLGLAASGAVLPYVGGGGSFVTAGINLVNPLSGSITGTVLHSGSISILEVASPVGSNAPPEESVFGAKPFHMFFFDQSCARVGPSVGLPLTTNDSEFFNLGTIGNIPAAGLIAAAGVDTSGGQANVLDPMSNAIHVRVLWVNIVDGTLSRILEPITIHNPEADVDLGSTIGRFVWNPLRTGATFVAPLEGSGVHTTLYLVCPKSSIIPGVFPEARGFPHLDPVPVPLNEVTPLFLRIYDDDENFKRNVDIACQCWGASPVAAIDPIYSNADPATGAPLGTFTEMEGQPACNSHTSPCSFTGYRSLIFGAGVVGNDFFGRLSNANLESLRGIPPININGFAVQDR